MLPPSCSSTAHSTPALWEPRTTAENFCLCPTCNVVSGGSIVIETVALCCGDVARGRTTVSPRRRSDRGEKGRGRNRGVGMATSHHISLAKSPEKISFCTTAPLDRQNAASGLGYHLICRAEARPYKDPERKRQWERARRRERSERRRLQRRASHARRAALVEENRTAAKPTGSAKKKEGKVGWWGLLVFAGAVLAGAFILPGLLPPGEGSEQ
jgi:hypothetical protein